jgi:NACHT domain
MWNDDEDGPGFVKWLKSDDSIYWITGLPGSGKSTLMKYLYENPQTQSFTSTNGRTVITIGYFFHELGTNKETSFESLLASILEVLLASFSTLAPLYVTYFVELKKRLKSGPGKLPWHESHLKKALELIGQSDAFGNVLLFVDGLDECSGDHRKQLEFLLPWIQSTQGKRLKIRMCLSSRPLPEIGLRLSTFPGCRIHEWTANDISAYVRDRLGHTRKSLALSDQKPHTHHNGTIVDYLTDKVIEKAQGVFLWVELVVNNLIVGLEEGFSDTELKECLDSLPPELEDLYARIFEQIPEDYIYDAMIYFKLALMGRTLGLLDFYLATRDPKEALARKNQSSYEDHLTMKYACTRAEKRIQSRCRGLLQVKQSEKDETTSRNTPSETKDTTPLVSVIGKNVGFLHLSVRDYIASRPFATSASFELGVDVAFMASSIGLLKLLQPDQLFQFNTWADRMSESVSKFSPLMEYTETNNYCESRFSGFRPIETLFIRAWFPADSPGSYQRRLLAELDRVCSLADENWHSFYLESALEGEYGETHIRVSPDCWNTDIFCLCLAYGLDTYVKEEIEVYAYKLEQRTGRPLLHFFFDLCYTQYTIPDPDILRLLLGRGAKPNEVFDEKTSWEYALLAMDHLLGNCIETPKNWTEPLMVLLEHGAIPNQSMGDSVSALMVVSRQLDEDNWLLDGAKELIKALIHGGVEMEQDELQWVGRRCGQKIRTFMEKTLEEIQSSSSSVVEAGL